MFDIGASELLLIVIVAILVIGPKDMPLAMRTAGRWIGKVRKVSAHFRTGIDAMVREAELEDMEKKWKAQNEAIMKKSAASSEDAAGEPVMTGPPPVADETPSGGEPGPDPKVEAPAPKEAAQSPELPLAPRRDASKPDDRA